MEKIRKYFKDVFRTTSIFVLSLGLIIGGIVFAAGTINGLNDTVSTGSIISASWYNVVNNMLNGPHTPGGICAYSNNKIMCNNTNPTFGGVTAKSVYGLRYGSEEPLAQSVALWNALVDEAVAKYPSIVGAGWDVGCRAGSNGALGGTDASRCFGWICNTKISDFGMENVSYQGTHCGTGSPGCDAGKRNIQCIGSK